MIRQTILGFLLVLISYSHTTARVDSMDYGNNTMEWRNFVTDEPAMAFAEGKGRVWYGTAAGAGTYSVKTNAKTVLLKLGDLPAQVITAMAPDGRGGVWIGTQEGLAYTNGGKKYSTHTVKNGLPDNAITKIHVSNNGTVWAGTGKGAASYKNGSWTAYSTAQGMCGNEVRDIASGVPGTVLFATNAGIAVFKHGQWSAYNTSNGMGSNDVKAIAWDPRKEMLWAAVGESDVNSFNGKEWDDFMDVQEDITCIMVDTQSRVWVGSSTGIIKYNGFEWVYDPAKMPFPAGMCNAMHRDKGGNLWFAIDTGVMRLKNPYPY